MFFKLEKLLFLELSCLCIFLWRTLSDKFLSERCERPAKEKNKINVALLNSKELYLHSLFNGKLLTKFKNGGIRLPHSTYKNICRHLSLDITHLFEAHRYVTILSVLGEILAMKIYPPVFRRTRKVDCVSEGPPDKVEVPISPKVQRAPGTMKHGVPKGEAETETLGLQREFRGVRESFLCIGWCENGFGVRPM